MADSPAPTFPHCVLQVVPNLDTGGVEQTTLDMADAIVKAGGRAIVASKGGRMEGRLKAAGAIFIPLPVHSKNPLKQLKNYFRLKKIIRAFKVDIVHVRSRAPALAAINAAKACKVKCLTTYHGIYKAKGKLKRWYNSWMVRGDVTIANSEFTRRHILSHYRVDPDKVMTVPRGVDIQRFDPARVTAEQIESLRKAWDLRADDTRPLLVLAGRLTRWKGHELILEALHRLRQRGITGVRVVFAGDSQGRIDYERHLKGLIDTYSLNDQVYMVGHCADMPAAFSLCDFALAPSVEPEAFGRTAVEPQAMAKPVLAADHGATSETVINNETGWLIAPGDADVWADAIERALNMPETERAAMGAKGMAHVRASFTLEAMCAATLDIYRHLLS
ncbi:glycosyltransferase family 4 protein [Asticcacaulis machinosus]|uniref:Glycosyltransferase family 4 protein n=1 Tax=Asticcacaulis machinosus TaxID=2984211 RepID=A0ABT5HK67_9CAUL|nr:glycosyltransferase family 4 protein [Asticcacaulis machinosus]MDC7676642.1 glycosyltransferase family 4 protein [Asticcacaulis machinosus]